MPIRAPGRDVGRVCANGGHFRWPSEGELTRFGLKMAILLQKWCTLGNTPQNQGRTSKSELGLPGLPSS